MNASSSMLLSEQVGDVRLLTVNRPDKLNAFAPGLMRGLDAALDAALDDDAVRAVVITGAGSKAFVAGNDVDVLATLDPMGAYRDMVDGHRVFKRLHEFAKPTIAMVNGYALGGGFELALACDLIIATTRSRFGLPEPLVGAVAIGGGMHRLARQIGLKQAMGLILSGDIVGAEEAHRLGIVTALVAPEALDATVEDWCRRLLRCAPLALRASKQTVMRGLDEPGLEAAMKHQRDYPAFEAWLNSSDRLEGATAFAEKRPPRWQGR